MIGNEKKFTVGNIFVVESTETNEMFRFKKGTTPFICASNFNNGIQGYVEPNTKTKIYPKNSLTVSSLDGTTFFQDKDFIGRGHGSVQVLINKNLNRYNSLFVATIIKKYCTPLNLSYSNQLFLNKLKQLEIELPCDGNQPDWNFMEKYIYERERDNNQNLMSRFLKVLPKLDRTNWKLFKLVGKDGLFKYSHGSRLKVADRKNGDIPLVTAGAFNNGVKGLFAPSGNDIYENALTIDMFGSVFYHDYKFICDDNIYPIFPIRNKYIGLFLSTVIQKHLNNNFGVQFREYILQNLKIMLPVKNNEPDWRYMENYIKQIKI